MNKMKLIPMLVIAMFLSLAFSNTGSAAVLDGNIAVSVTGTIGLVTPRINLTEVQMNQSVNFMVNVTENPSDPTNDSYIVEDNLTINLDINDTTGRSSFILSRSVGYSILLIRDKSKIETKPIFGYLRRLIPVHELLKSVKVVDSLLGKKVNSFNVTIKYAITKSSWENRTTETENVTLYINTMGLLPGDVDGVSGVRILDLKKINLEVTYVPPYCPI
jgi:hypothetical protein